MTSVTASEMKITFEMLCIFTMFDSDASLDVFLHDTFKTGITVHFE